MFLVLECDIPWGEVDGSIWGIVLQIVCLFYCFCGLAIVCDEHMVPSLDTLCHRWGIGEDVAGATFMAFGSAAPEMIINTVATIQGATNPETTSLGVSAIIGSGMIAFSLIPAACGFCAPGDLQLKRRPLFRDQYFYLQSLAILVYIMFDGVVKVWEAALLVVNYCVYLFVIVFSTRIRKWYWESILKIQWAEKDQSLIHHNNTTTQSESFHETGKSYKEWHDHLNEMGFEDFVVPFEEHEWDDPNLWKGMTAVDFEKMGLNKRGRVAKFRRYLEDPANNHQKMYTPGVMDSSFEDEEEEEEGLAIKVLEFLTFPLNFLFDNTCPDCEMGQPYEAYYLSTFFVSLFYVAVFSFILSSIVERWVYLSGVSMIFFGLILVSFGAEIPDTIESVTVAKKGYGSMAVSNCQGTQVINICLGLGLPWAISILGGNQIVLNRSLVPPAMFQFALVFVNMGLLLGTAICQGLPKAVLGRTKSILLVLTYFSCISGMGCYLRYTGEL